jgi:hypothetical protein
VGAAETAVGSLLATQASQAASIAATPQPLDVPTAINDVETLAGEIITKTPLQSKTIVGLLGMLVWFLAPFITNYLKLGANGVQEVVYGISLVGALIFFAIGLWGRFTAKTIIA